MSVIELAEKGTYTVERIEKIFIGDIHLLSEHTVSKNEALTLDQLEDRHTFCQKIDLGSGFYKVINIVGISHKVPLTDLLELSIGCENDIILESV